MSTVKRLSLTEMEQRKSDSLAVRRIEDWLKKEELTRDVLSQRAIDVIRIVMDGKIK